LLRERQAHKPQYGLIEQFRTGLIHASNLLSPSFHAVWPPWRRMPQSAMDARRQKLLS
jgi:hypothetical protein